MPNHSMLDKKVAKTTNLCDESIFSQFHPIDPQRVSCGCWRHFLFLILMARSYNDKWKSFSIIFYTQKIKIFLRQLLIRFHVLSRQLHLEVDVWAFVFPEDGTLVSATIGLFAMKKHLVKGRVEKDHNFMPNHSMLDKKVAKTINLCDESIFSQCPLWLRCGTHAGVGDVSYF